MIMHNAHAGALLAPADSYGFEQLARAVSEGSAAHEVVVDERSDVLIARAPTHDGASVIVKLWNRRTLKGALRRLTRTNAGYREWRALRVLYDGGVNVPQTLAYAHLLDRECRHTEALVLEDLGQCDDALTRACDMIERGDREGLTRLENDLIETTAAILECGIVDVDHRMNNFVVTPDDRLMRIDLEHGRALAEAFGQRRMAVMVGTLIGSYVFAVQPRIELAESFAQRLARRIAPVPRGVLHRAAGVVDAMLRQQRETCGVDSRIALHW